VAVSRVIGTALQNRELQVRATVSIRNSNSRGRDAFLHAATQRKNRADELGRAVILLRIGYSCVQPHDRHQPGGDGAMDNKFTIWVRNEQRAQMRIVVRNVTNLNAAIRQALEKAALEWARDPDTLTIYGIAEGDVTDLEPESSSD
jgi:hypothetical protein